MSKRSVIHGADYFNLYLLFYIMNEYTDSHLVNYEVC